MKAYLITGGAGFIGSNFVRYMLKKYSTHDSIKIINLDALTYAGNIENLSEVASHPSYHFIHGDICNEPLVTDIFERYEIRYVINFAAESHVDRSIQDPSTFLRTNIIGTFNLLKIAHAHWQINKDKYKEGCRFLQISTDEVYGSLEDTGCFSEGTRLDPHSPYSASKASADHLVKSYHDTYQMPVIITRCSNNYGPNQHLEKLIPKVISQCLKCEKIPVYGNGQNVRDWLYVEDHCRAIDMVLHKGKLGNVYNIGGHNEMKNLDLVKLIINYIKEKLAPDDSRRMKISEDLIEFVIDRKGHDWRYAIDTTKITTELGWLPQVTFNEGIERTISWYLKKFDNS